MSETEKNFQFRGTQRNQEQLKEIFRLLLSVPSGFAVVRGVVQSRALAKKKIVWLSHPGVKIFFNKAPDAVAGMTDIHSNKISLSQCAADGHNMLESLLDKDKISIAATLGHEMRHVMTRYGYLSLMLYAQTTKEALLAKLLHEEDAYFIGDRIESELYASNDTVVVPRSLKERLRKYSGVSGRLMHFNDVMDGNFVWSLTEMRAAKRRGFCVKQINPEKTMRFQELIETWLKNMGISTSVEAVMNAPILQKLDENEPKRPSLFARLFHGGRHVK